MTYPNAAYAEMAVHEEPRLPPTFRLRLAEWEIRLAGWVLASVIIIAVWATH